MWHYCKPLSVNTVSFFFFYSDEVISNLRDLQSLTINTSAEKEKQKAEVKHILQQKQRALSDLFKMLTEIGDFSSLICRLHCNLLWKKKQSSNLSVHGPIKACRTVKD